MYSPRCAPAQLQRGQQRPPCEGSGGVAAFWSAERAARRDIGRAPLLLVQRKPRPTVQGGATASRVGSDRGAGTLLGSGRNACLSAPEARTGQGRDSRFFGRLVHGFARTIWGVEASASPCTEGKAIRRNSKSQSFDSTASVAAIGRGVWEGPPRLSLLRTPERKPPISRRHQRHITIPLRRPNPI